MTETGQSASRTLFVTSEGEALKFYIRPCSERVKLRPLIEEHGGVLLGIPDPAAYRLILKEDQPPKLTKNNIKVQFIYDCINANKLLSLEDYRIRIRSEDELDIDDIEDIESVHPVTHTLMRNTACKPYSAKEDKKIIDYVVQNEAYGDVKGRALWVDMENDIFKDQRTWQSLKERYLKRIVPKIMDYHLHFEHYELIKKGCNLWTRKDETRKAQRNKCKKKQEDIVIIDSASSNESENSNDTVVLPCTEGSNSQQASATENVTASTSNASEARAVQSKDGVVGKSSVPLYKRPNSLFQGFPIRTSTPNLSKLSSRIKSSCSKETDGRNVTCSSKNAQPTSSPSRSQIISSSPLKRKVEKTSVPDYCNLTKVPCNRNVEVVESRASIVENSSGSSSSDQPELHLSLPSVNSQETSDESSESELVKKQHVEPLLTSSDDDSEVIVDTAQLNMHTNEVTKIQKECLNSTFMSQYIKFFNKNKEVDSFDEDLLEEAQVVRRDTASETSIQIPQNSEFPCSESEETLTAAHLLDSLPMLDEDAEHFPVPNSATKQRRTSSVSQEKNNADGGANSATDICKNIDLNHNECLSNSSHKNMLHPPVEETFSNIENVLCFYEQQARKRNSPTLINTKDVVIPEEDFRTICSNFRNLKYKFLVDNIMHKPRSTTNANDTKILEEYLRINKQL